LARIICETQNAHARVGSHARDGVIRRAVVDEEDFEIEPGESGGQLGLQDRHVLFFIKEGDDDGDSRSGHNGNVR
jgi:hypothetical protein